MNMTRLWLVVVVTLLLFYSCATQNPQPATATTTTTPPAPRPPAPTTPLAESPAPKAKPRMTAVQVGRDLKAGGLPITYDITDTTSVKSGLADVVRKFGGSPIKGLVSSAETATNETDLSIQVFESDESRNAARLQYIKNCPGCNFIAECGPIMVSAVDGGTSASNRISQKEVRLAGEIMHKKYGCR